MARKTIAGLEEKISFLESEIRHLEEKISSSLKRSSQLVDTLANRDREIERLESELWEIAQAGAVYAMWYRNRVKP